MSAVYIQSTTTLTIQWLPLALALLSSVHTTANTTNIVSITVTISESPPQLYNPHFYNNNNNNNNNKYSHRSLCKPSPMAWININFKFSQTPSPGNFLFLIGNFPGIARASSFVYFVYFKLYLYLFTLNCIVTLFIFNCIFTLFISNCTFTLFILNCIFTLFTLKFKLYVYFVYFKV